MISCAVGEYAPKISFFQDYVGLVTYFGGIKSNGPPTGMAVPNFEKKVFTSIWWLKWAKFLLLRI